LLSLPIVIFTSRERACSSGQPFSSVLVIRTALGVISNTETICSARRDLGKSAAIILLCE
jgi:hypothetical protein